MSSNSLQQLDSRLSPNGDKSKYLIQRHNELLTKDIDSFTVEDLRFMIGQQTGLQYLVPLSISILEKNQFAEGDFFEGDLLLNMFKVEGDFWINSPEMTRKFRSIIIRDELNFENIETTDEIIEKITTARDQFLSVYKNV